MFDTYKNPIHGILELEEISAVLAPKLELTAEGVDPRVFLLAISGVESSFAKNCGPRYEPAYGPKGNYFNNDRLKAAYVEWGALASCSYGPWQILYITAHEGGFEGCPLELHHGDVSGEYVVKKFNFFSRNGANSVERLCQAWNTGNFRDSEPPLNYISKFWNFYNQLIGEK